MKYSRILIIRTDRIGDCILSTPAVAFLKKLFPSAEIDVLTTPYTADVFSGNPHIREVILDDPMKTSVFSGQFMRLIGGIRKRKYEICFILHLSLRASVVPFLAGIPTRVAPASKIYQFLANRRIVQKRSHCLMNESEYNVDLIKKFLGVEGEEPPSSLYFDDASAAFMSDHLNREFLRLRGVSYDEFKKNGGKMVLVHPGCGGSALNMSIARYAEVMEKLYKLGFEIFLSTGPQEAALKKELISKLSFMPISYGDDLFKHGRVLSRSFALISKCDAALAPSTGIMHAAVALSKPVAALFCPIFVCMAKRWGPAPHSRAESVVLTPDVKCSDDANITHEKYCKRCIKSQCAYYNCMDGLSSETVVDCVLRIAGRAV